MQLCRLTGMRVSECPKYEGFARGRAQGPDGVVVPPAVTITATCTGLLLALPPWDPFPVPCPTATNPVVGATRGLHPPGSAPALPKGRAGGP